MRRKCVCLGLTALLLGLLALLTSWECRGWYLVLRNADTGQYYGRYAMDEGDWFSVSFVHSVNKSPVTDCYQIRDRAIYVEKTIYYDFGAGVQTQLEGEETLSYGEDGSMIVSGFDREMPDLTYFVGHGFRPHPDCQRRRTGEPAGPVRPQQQGALPLPVLLVLNRIKNWV